MTANPETYWTIHMEVFSFATKEEAAAFADKLTEALARLRAVTPPDEPWAVPGWEGEHAVGNTRHAIATILNAVAAGELVPAHPAQEG